MTTPHRHTPPTDPGGARTVDRWHDDEPEPVDVAAGEWTAQLRGDSLDDIRYAGTPVLRAVRFVVRDHNWRTVPTRVTQLTVHHDQQGLTAEITARTADSAVHLDWTGVLHLHGDAFHFAVDAAARNAFHRNRIGIVVLHHPAAAGTAVDVTTPAGTTSTVTFPDAVAPHQPATDIAELTWTTGPLTTTLTLHGDVFETEDQRNWTDASFKIYSTPLSRPFPVAVHPGDRIRHAAELRCTPSGQPADPARPQNGPGVIDLPPPRFATTIPELAAGAYTGPTTTPPPPPDGGGTTTLVELDLDAANWADALRRAAADTPDGALDVRLIASTAAAIEPAVAAAARHHLRRLAVFDRGTHVSEAHLDDALQRAAAAHCPAVDLIVGTRAHFTELNRQHHRLPRDAAALTFSITPQMHDRSRHQVVESIPMQRLLADQATSIAAGRPVHIGPVTLRPRFNAVATSPPPPGTHRDVDNGYGAHHVDDATDPRQVTPAAGAWLIASAAALTVPGVASLTYHETRGPRGLRPTGGGAPHPAGRAFQWLTELQGQPCDTQLLPAAAVAVITCRRPDGYTVLIANLSDRAHTVRLHLDHVTGGHRDDLTGAPPTSLLPPEAAALQFTVAAADASRLQLTTRA